MNRITVKFASKFVHIFSVKEKIVELEYNATVRDLLNLLCDNQSREKSIFDSDGELRPDVMLSKNRVFVFHLQRLETKLNDGDVIDIFYPACMG